MIRIAESKDAKEIIRFLSFELPDSVLAKIEASVLEQNIKSGKQISFLIKENEKLIAHCGIFWGNSLAIIGGLAVSKEHRRKGIGGKLAASSIDYCTKKLPITHIATYVTLMHKFAQSLFDDSFLPIGVSLNAYNIHAKKSVALSGEIVLCKNLTGKNFRINLPYMGAYRSQVKELYNSIGFNVQISKKQALLKEPKFLGYLEIDVSKTPSHSLVELAEKNNYKFLGIFPSANDGFKIIGFASPEIIRNFPRVYETNNLERNNFVKSVLFT